MKTLELSRKYYDWMVELRRDFHKHPEESFKNLELLKNKRRIE